MTLFTCRDCGKAIYYRAGTCPNCGARVRDGFTFTTPAAAKTLGLRTLVIALLISTGLGMMVEGGHPRTTALGVVFMLSGLIGYLLGKLVP
jgi:hypothetical protein